MMRKFLKVFSLLVLLAGIPIGIYLVGKATGFFGKASGTPANLIIDLGISSPSNYSWKNLSQGGEERGDMFTNIISEVTNLHPNYIRIDHVFDFFDIENGWTNLDRTINDITSTGAKPFISLSPLPDTPINWTDWESKVQNLIQHISGTLGLNNVYYEVGNEPDLFGGWKTYGPKNYFDLYAHSVVGANNANKVKPFKIGGPATTQLYETWSKDFAKFILANHLRLDFYSWHKYSTSLDNLANNAMNARAWLAESGLSNNLELIISEIGPDSNNSPVYDTNEGAIHAIAATATLEDSLNKIFTFEVKDGPINKWGILSQDGVPKPRYNALLFLNKMAGASLHVSGQGSWVKAFAKNDGKTTRTLIVNYDPNNIHTESIPITFTNLKFQNFEFKRIDFNGGVVKDISVSTTSSSWSALELLNPNTAGILEITPK
jgi:hypothetical protein